MIDSHAHVAFSAFDTDRAQVVARLQPAGVSGWVEVGTDIEQSRKAVALAEQYDTCWATVGVHPDDVGELSDLAWHKLEKLAQHKKVVAIGEVGFDFHHLPQANGAPRSLGEVGSMMKQQHIVLARFVELALRVKKPIVFHVRDPVKSPDGDHGASAHETMIEFLQSYGAGKPRGVIHTFSGNEEQAKQYLELGMYLSFSGVLTFPKKAEVIQEVARTMPLDRILIETDCPFLTPQAHRGQRNEPSYVRFVAEKLAEMRGVSLTEIDQATEENTRRLFDIN